MEFPKLEKLNVNNSAQIPQDDRADFHYVINEYNARVDIWNSKEFRNKFAKASKTGFFSAERKIQNLISTSQKLVKDFKTSSLKVNKSLKSLVEELKKKKNQIDDVTKDTDNKKDDNDKAEKLISMFESVINQNEQSINKFKAQKREIKKLALSAGIATEKTLNNAIKYMANDMTNIYNRINTYINSVSQGKVEENNTISSIKDMLSSDNKRSWKLNYEKINTCTNKPQKIKGLSSAINDAIKIGEKIYKTIPQISPTAEEVDPNFINEQQSTLNTSIKNAIIAQFNLILTKYKLKSTKEKIRSLVYLAISNTILNKLINSSIDKNKVLTTRIKSMNFVKINELLKSYQTSKNDINNDNIKNRHISFRGVIWKIFKFILKLAATLALIAVGLFLTAVFFVAMVVSVVGSVGFAAVALYYGWKHTETTLTISMWEFIGELISDIWKS